MARSNLQSAIDTFEEYAALRSGDLNERTIPSMARARGQWTASDTPDVVQKMAEYRGLREALIGTPAMSDSARHPEVLRAAAQDMREWAEANGVDVQQHNKYLVEYAVAQTQEVSPAQPGRSYAGHVVSVTDTHVIQQVGEQRIEHESRALAGAKLTQDSIGKEVSIDYPQGKLGLVRDPAMERKVEAPALRHEFGGR